MLEVIVGMVFTFMLLSLLGTTVNELVSSWRGWRGHFLEDGLKRLLEYKDNPKHFEKFTQNSFYQQLMAHKTLGRKSRAPSYLSSKDFSSILTNILKKGLKEIKGADGGGAEGSGETFEPNLEQVQDFLDSLDPDSKLRQVLEQLKDEGHENIDAYKARIETWFDGVMGQASDWYKRHLQFVTIFVGLGIAGVLNADSFQIYQHLTQNTVDRGKLAELAVNYAENNDAAPTIESVADTLSIKDIQKKAVEFTESGEFAEMSNILGLGWREGDASVGFMDWLVRLLGWFITALAISLGAPFWFNILKKIVSISGRGGGGGGQPTQVVINTTNADLEKK